MSRMIYKMSNFTMGGAVYQRKQYKKARYRKKEQRQWDSIHKNLMRLAEMHLT